jgi:hypothetical protein
MCLQRPGLWISLLVLLVCSIVVGCTSSAPTGTSAPAESPDPDALPDSYPAGPSPEPGPRVTTPEIEPTEMETASTGVPTPVPEPVALNNPGFENQEAGGTPEGWSTTGAAEAVLVEENGHSGDFRLTHRGSEAYLVETTQTVSGLAD